MQTLTKIKISKNGPQELKYKNDPKKASNVALGALNIASIINNPIAILHIFPLFTAFFNKTHNKIPYITLPQQHMHKNEITN